HRPGGPLRQPGVAAHLGSGLSGVLERPRIGASGRGVGRRPGWHPHLRGASEGLRATLGGPLGASMADRARIVPVVAVLAATLTAALDQTVVGTVMPTVVGELGGIDRYAWVFSAYLLLLTVATPISGRLADLVGRKPVYLVGLGIFHARSALLGLRQDLDELRLSRPIQRLGAAAR